MSLGLTLKKIQKLYNLPTNLRVGNKSPMLFMKKPLREDDLLSENKIFIERPQSCSKRCKKDIKTHYFKANVN